MRFFLSGLHAFLKVSWLINKNCGYYTTEFKIDINNCTVFSYSGAVHLRHQQLIGRGCSKYDAITMPAWAGRVQTQG